MFVPIGTERSSRGFRAPSKDGNYTSTDSEELEGTRRGRAKAKRRKENPRFRRDSRGSEASQVHREENLSDYIQKGQDSRLKVPENSSHFSKHRENVSKNTEDITQPSIPMSIADKTNQKQYIPENMTSTLENKRPNVLSNRKNMTENKESIPSHEPNIPEGQPNIRESKQNVPEKRETVLEAKPKPDLIENKAHAPNPQPQKPFNPQNVRPEGKSNPLPAHQTQAPGEF